MKFLRWKTVYLVPLVLIIDTPSTSGIRVAYSVEILNDCLHKSDK